MVSSDDAVWNEGKSTCDGLTISAAAACCLAFCCSLKAPMTAAAAFCRSRSLSFPISLLLPALLSGILYDWQDITVDISSPAWTYFSCGVTRIITRHRFSVLLASSSRLRILSKSSLRKGHFALSQIGLNLSIMNEVGFSFSPVEVTSSFRIRPFAASILPWSSLNRVWQRSRAGVNTVRFAENRFFDPGMECSPSCSCKCVLLSHAPFHY